MDRQGYKYAIGFSTQGYTGVSARQVESSKAKWGFGEDVKTVDIEEHRGRIGFTDLVVLCNENSRGFEPFTDEEVAELVEVKNG